MKVDKAPRPLTTDRLVNEFMNNVVHKTGTPLILRSDDAQDCLAHLSHEMVQKLGIVHSTVNLGL